MRVFYDFEFIEDGKTIDPISIGMVAEDGRTYYAQNAECKFRRASEWVKENVLAHLPYFDARKMKPRIGPYEAPGAFSVWRNRSLIADEVKAFCDPTQHGKLELWGYYSGYDHVALCHLFGKMIDLPSDFPMWTNDLQQMAYGRGINDLATYVPQTDEHSAIADARWNKDAWEWLQRNRMEQIA